MSNFVKIGFHIAGKLSFTRYLRRLCGLVAEAILAGCGGYVVLDAEAMCWIN
jgi:hypothetical protein